MTAASVSSPRVIWLDPIRFSALPERPPEMGDLVQVRSRRWLVEEVTPSETPGQSPVVTLACAHDDAQGQALRVYWDFEIDRRILERRAGSTSRRRASTTRAGSRRSCTRCAGAA